MKGFKKLLPEFLILLFVAVVFMPTCVMVARSARADSSGVEDHSGQKVPAPTAQYRGTSQLYDVTITDSGHYSDPEFKRLVEMDRCEYYRGSEYCVNIIGVGHPHHDGFWEWTEVRQYLRVDQHVTERRIFRPEQEKCYALIGESRPRKRKRCTVEEDVVLIELTLQLGDACEEILKKNKETPSRSLRNSPAEGIS